MKPCFQIGDLLIDKRNDPHLVALIEEVECTNGNIIYKCICPSSHIGLLWWKEQYLIDGVVDGTAEVQRVKH